MSNHPRLIIAGTNSGCGKTTIVLGIMVALIKKGYHVQPFKTGPDYIDTSYHSEITGLKSRNLDTWLLDKDVVLELFEHTTQKNQKANISIIEGVMGLYDGFIGESDGKGSTAHLAKLLKSPVILIVDAQGMATSAAAIVMGFNEFDPELNITGVIFNRVGSLRHFQALSKAIEDKCPNIKVLGYLPKNDKLTIRERHLGLTMLNKQETIENILPLLTEEIIEHIDLELLVKIAQDVYPVPSYTSTIFPTILPAGRVSIGVAMDEAFCFYYEDNLNILRSLGAELVYFSPLNDIQLPVVDGLYFGGGFPELFGNNIESNISMRTWVTHASNLGMPIYAECGGMLYLMDRLITHENKTYPMVGLISGEARMQKRLTKLGYCMAIMLEDNILGQKGTTIRGHRFHWSNLENTQEPNAYKINDNEKAGFIKPNLLASYIHIHFGTQLSLAQNFVDNCCRYKEVRMERRKQRW
ncbi:cobyrinate a,c-diamide synthase [Candidatus Desantisbacteria bacterium]|nr:cobyrinate a,c-diamide synthase [Candidatus Desantisbacteria bacterium]